MPKAYSSAGTFTRRIGSTNYRVVVHYCPDENENFESKVTRMIRNDLAFFDSESENGFQNSLICGMISMPQMSRSA